MRIERNADVPAQPLRLHGEELNLLRVLANGQSVSFRNEDGLLVIDNLPAGEFTLEIRNTCAPETNTQLSGLYTLGRRLLHAVRGRGLPPHHLLPGPARRDGGLHRHAARRQGRATRCCCPTATCVEQGELDNGRHFAKWHDPVPEAELPVRARRRRPGRARTADPHPRRPRAPAAGLRAARRPRQDRARDELARRQRGLGRGAVRACRSTWSAS